MMMVMMRKKKKTKKKNKRRRKKKRRRRTRRKGHRDYRTGQRPGACSRGAEAEEVLLGLYQRAQKQQAALPFSWEFGSSQENAKNST